MHISPEANNFQFGVQIMNEEDELKFGFDLLDPTKIVPEEYVPITWLGKFELNRTPRDYFSETEQVMVCKYLSNCLPFMHVDSEFSSNPAMLSVVSTSPMTHCSRVVCSPTWTPSLTAMAVPISSSFPSTDLVSPFTTTIATVLVSHQP